VDLGSESRWDWGTAAQWQWGVRVRGLRRTSRRARRVRLSLTAGGGPAGLGVALAPSPTGCSCRVPLDFGWTLAVAGGRATPVGERGVSAAGLVAVPLLRVALASLPPGRARGKAGGSPLPTWAGARAAPPSRFGGGN
jgi:hypothetical protein